MEEKVLLYKHYKLMQLKEKWKNNLNMDKYVKLPVHTEFKKVLFLVH